MGEEKRRKKAGRKEFAVINFLHCPLYFVCNYIAEGCVHISFETFSKRFQVLIDTKVAIPCVI